MQLNNIEAKYFNRQRDEKLGVISETSDFQRNLGRGLFWLFKLHTNAHLNDPSKQWKVDIISNILNAKFYCITT